MEDFFEDLKNRPRPNFFRRIYLWWNHDGRYYHKYFKQGVKNILYWFPVIWKDRDWDGHYIFEILQHKLTAQANYIGKRDFHTRAQQDARRMRLCVKLIKKVQEEDYTMEYLDYHKDRVWFTDVEERPGNSLYNSEEIWEKYDDYFARYPLVYKRVMKGEGIFTLDGRSEADMKRVIAMNIAHLNHDRARKLLFKIMEENIEGWWD
jgi:hypothetical protein